MTRGPLPASVYWRRRLFVLTLAGTLVFVIASFLSGGSDARDDDVPVARQAGNEVVASATVTADTRADRKGRQGRKDRKGKRRQHGPTQGPSFDPSLVEAEPRGNCDPADIRITPRVDAAVAGKPVTIGLALQTVQADACYFRVGADKISVKITRKGRRVWASHHCPGGVPKASVVVRRVIATVVPMEWTPYPQGTRHGRECPGTRTWLMPADYEVTAAALGGEPTTSDFALVSPTPETITASPDPKKREQDKADRKKRDRGEQPRR